ncbi:hypothetical protein J6590_100179 [Homalodisca vitripennis]|nr:hypothetical protein J6590_100179 [Homalodisca vitripennis]
MLAEALFNVRCYEIISCSSAQHLRSMCRHIDRSSEIDRLLLRDCESESDDADPNFEIYSDHDTESEFDLDEVCEAGQHEEEIDRKGRSLLQPYMSLRAQQGNLPREIRALAAKFSGTPIPAKENPEP